MRLEECIGMLYRVGLTADVWVLKSVDRPQGEVHFARQYGTETMTVPIHTVDTPQITFEGKLDLGGKRDE